MYTLQECAFIVIFYYHYRAKHPVKVHVWAGFQERAALESAYLKGLWTNSYS